MIHQEMEFMVKGEQRNGRAWSQGRLLKWLLSEYVCIPVKRNQKRGMDDIKMKIGHLIHPDARKMHACHTARWPSCSFW